MKDCLKNLSATETNAKWKTMIERENELYARKSDVRSEFERDYTRVIHSLAFRRLKHKTQVFFSPVNDHICTRMEHVILVESISNTIANYCGLNAELTKAIAMAHDIGHSPFGHQGERILSKISERDLGKKFWHERNGMEMVDKIILLENDKQKIQNLNLTYAVRDGIISHCGEIDENGLKPREEAINLYDFNYPNEYKPYTWEGCAVKVADKIAYLGRDIQDAIRIGIIDKHLKELRELMNIDQEQAINNSIIINYLLCDLCENSSVTAGFKFSDKAFDFLQRLKDFNYLYIYKDERLNLSARYFELVLTTIYDTLKRYYTDKEHIQKLYPDVISQFEEWLAMYWDLPRKEVFENKTIFHIEDEKEFCQAILYYISGMTDNYVIDTFNRIVRF